MRQSVLLRHRPRRGNETGAQAVEFAIVSTLLLGIVFAIVAFGFIFSAQIGLNSAARDAARAAVVQPFSGIPKTCASIAAEARNGVNAIGVNRPVYVEVAGPGGRCRLPGPAVAGDSPDAALCTGALDAQTVQVVLRYTAKPPVPAGPLSSVDLEARGEFQCEYR